MSFIAITVGMLVLQYALYLVAKRKLAARATYRRRLGSLVYVQPEAPTIARNRIGDN